MKGSIRLGLFIAAFTAVLPHPASAQRAYPRDPIMDEWANERIGESIGSAVGETIGFVQNWVAMEARITARVARARAAFRAALASGQGLAAAEEELGKALSEKDSALVYVGLVTLYQSDQSVKDFTRKIDGGVHPRAEREWDAWMNAMNAFVKDNTPRGTQGGLAAGLGAMQNLTKAIAANERERRDYTRARNWAELEESGLKFSWQTDPVAHGVMLFQRYGPSDTQAQARARFEEMVTLFGEARVLAAAERMRAAPRAATTWLLDRSKLSPAISIDRPDIAFQELIASSDGESFARYLLWQKAGEKIAVSDPVFNRLVLAYSKESVARAGAAVASINGNRMALQPSLLNDPRAIGAGRRTPDLAMEDLLFAQSDAAKFVFALIVQANAFDTRPPAEAALQQFFAKHGEAKVKENADLLRKLLSGTGGPVGKKQADQWIRLTNGKTQNAAFYLGILQRMVAEGAVAVIGETNAADFAQNPEHALWSAYGPGTKLVIRHESLRREDRTKKFVVSMKPSETAYTLKTPGDSIAWETEMKTFTNGVAGPAEVRTATLTKIREEEAGTIPWKSQLTNQPWRQMPGVVRVEKDTLEIGGRTIECDKFTTSENGTLVSYWLSDAVPGRFVRLTSGGGERDTFQRQITLLSFESVPNPQPPANSPPPPILVKHPLADAEKDDEAASWLRHGPGTEITIEQQREEPAGVLWTDTYTVKEMGDEWVTLGRTQTFQGLGTPEKETKDVGIGRRLSMNRRLDVWQSTLNRGLPFKAAPGKAVFSGKENIEIGEQQYACERYVEDRPAEKKKITMWFSDDVPGRLVRHLVEPYQKTPTQSVIETRVKSFTPVAPKK